MSELSDAPATPASPFADLAAFVALPRVAGLALSADGRRLAVAVQTLDAERKKWQSALWEVDPEGRRPARRLRSRERCARTLQGGGDRSAARLAGGADRPTGRQVRAGTRPPGL